MKKMYVIEFELELIAESPTRAYASALEKLADLVKKQQALGVPEIFDEVPNGGIDGAAPSPADPGWKCVFAIREKAADVE